MVGGTVVGVSRKNGQTLLNVQDNTYKGQYCAVRCTEKRADTGATVAIMVGDQVWWQSGRVYWWAGGVAEKDVPLPKVGYSH